MSKVKFDDQADAASAAPHRFSPVRAVTRAVSQLYGGRKPVAAAPVIPAGGASKQSPEAAFAGEVGDFSPIAQPFLTADRSGDSLLAILNAMLAPEPDASGPLPLDDGDFDLAILATTACDDFSRCAEARGVTLELAVSPGAHGRYRGDALRVRQILLSLISNALKLTASGAVTVAAEWRGETLALSVTDTGVGVSADRLARLLSTDEVAAFKPGRRRLRGRAICREAVALMGGSMMAESAPGVGSQFTVVLPLTRIVEDAEPVMDVAGPTRMPATPVATFEPGLRVLVVEADPVSQLVLTTLLADLGLEPVVAGDADEALAAWRQEAWDLILLNTEAPAIAGLTVARAIRAAEVVARWSRTPMLALAASASPADVADHLAAGMDGHVVKPFGATALQQAIDAALSLEAATSPVAAGSAA